jgi:hypothetical protein
MERCLNKQVLVASATVFQDPKRTGWEPMAFSEEKLESVGHKWGYIFNRREAKTLIPTYMKLTWLGHSAFRIEAGAAKILIDPLLSDNPSWDKGWSGYLAGKNSTQGGDR